MAFRVKRPQASLPLTVSTHRCGSCGLLVIFSQTPPLPLRFFLSHRTFLADRLSVILLFFSCSYFYLFSLSILDAIFDISLYDKNTARYPSISVCPLYMRKPIRHSARDTSEDSNSNHAVSSLPVFYFPA